MPDTDIKKRPKTRNKTARPKMHKVILLNDDYTPRDFVVRVLRAVFGTNSEKAQMIMITAHQKGSCVVAVYTAEVAESKAIEATDLGRQAGLPLTFTSEPEE